MERNFYRPDNREEALKLHAEGGIFLAGGTEINRGWPGDGGLPGIPGGSFSAEEDLIYLEDLGLKGIRSEAGSIFIGACVTLQEIGDNTGLPGWLRKAAGFLPSRNVRNMATLGGNIAAGRSNSVLLPGLLAADVRIHMAGSVMLTAESYLLALDEYRSAAPLEKGASRGSSWRSRFLMSGLRDTPESAGRSRKPGLIWLYRW